MVVHLISRMTFAIKSLELFIKYVIFCVMIFQAINLAIELQKNNLTDSNILPRMNGSNGFGIKLVFGSFITVIIIILPMATLVIIESVIHGTKVPRAVKITRHLKTSSPCVSIELNIFFNNKKCADMIFCYSTYL